MTVYDAGENSFFTKSERLKEFLQRLGNAPSAASLEEAFQQLSEILNAVENEMTSIPFNPENWETDGRIYPPQPDNISPIPGRSDLTRFRNRSHYTVIRDNGAIEIREKSGRTIFSKLGADGRTV